MNVPFVDMPAELAPIRSEIDRAIARVLDSGVFIGGPEVEAFERELAEHLGVRHAVGVSSGTDALLATFMAMGIGPGDEVVTTPFTFFATAGSIARLGATVVFADIDDETMCLDPVAALAACTERTKAIVPVNLFGYPAELPVTDIPIIEDAAQSIGVPLRGRAATLSFFPTKNLGAIGDAGAVITNDDDLADRIRLLRNHGARPKYHHIALGGNFRIDAIQAAVLRAKLPHLPRWTALRRASAAHYRELISAANLASVRLPADHVRHAYHQFVIRVPQRGALRAFLAAQGMATEVYYPAPLHVQPCLQSAARAELRSSMLESTDVLALPMGPSVSPDARAQLVRAIAAFFEPTLTGHAL